MAQASASDRQQVLFITRKWPPAVGGMETYSLELSKAMASFVSLEVRSLAGRANGGPPYGTRLMLFFLSSIFYLWKNRNRFDLVHFGDFVLFPLAWVHWKLVPQAKRVLTVHGLDLVYGNRSGFGPFVYRRFVNWARKGRGALGAIIANSKNTAGIIDAEGFGTSTVIPLGVALSETRKPGHIAPEEPYLLFVGRVVPRKGAGWFADEVLPQLPGDMVLKVAGKVWNAKEGERLRRNRRVRLLGFVSDDELASLRSGAVAIVMPNIHIPGNKDVEGFGITALEAAASGTPLVAADLEGLSDAVAHGKTGFLVNPSDGKAWVDQIRRIIAWSKADRMHFADGAKELLEREFSWHRVAEDTFHVYRTLLET